MVWRGAPKCVQFTLIFKIGLDQFSVTTLIVPENLFQIKGCGVLFCAARQAFHKIRQGVEKNFDVLNVAHRALIFVHSLEITFGIRW